jgi:hypothetical protein
MGLDRPAIEISKNLGRVVNTRRQLRPCFEGRMRGSSPYFKEIFNSVIETQRTGPGTIV